MITLVKTVAGLAAGIGTNILCTEAIKTVRPKNASALARVCIWVAGVGLGAVVGDIAAKGTDGVIESMEIVTKKLMQKKES